MGCKISSSVNAYNNPKIAQLRPLFESLNIDEICINKLHLIFAKCDISNDGMISDKEMMILLKLPSSPFLERVFRIFDTDNSGECDFKEFVLAVYNFATISHENLPYFAFSLYDLDNELEIKTYEVECMLKDIWKQGFETNKIAQNIHKELINPKLFKTSMTLSEFLLFVRNHDRFLFPITTIVTRLQDAILGKKYWSKQTEMRASFTNGKYVKFEDLLDMRYPEKDIIEPQIIHPSQIIRRKSLQKSIGLPVKPKRISANIKRTTFANTSPTSKRNTMRQIHLESYKQ